MTALPDLPSAPGPRYRHGRTSNRHRLPMAPRAIRSQGLLACLLALLAGASILAQDDPAPKPSIGVVDFVKVFDAYPKYVRERKKLDENHASVQGKLDELKRQIEEKKAQRELLAADSRERAQADLELDLSMRQYNGLAQIWLEDLGRQADKLAVECYEDIERAIQKVATARGLTLVLRLHRETRTNSIGDRIKVYERRLVWYAADEVDLTAEVIKRMQVADEASRPSGAGAAPSGKTGTADGKD
ncbi:MAG: hypothetical protein Fur0037_18860 [Planctomycetota bacterium]